MHGQPHLNELLARCFDYQRRVELTHYRSPLKPAAKRALSNPRLTLGDAADRIAAVADGDDSPIGWDPVKACVDFSALKESPDLRLVNGYYELTTQCPQSRAWRWTAEEVLNRISVKCDIDRLRRHASASVAFRLLQLDYPELRDDEMCAAVAQLHDSGFTERLLAELWERFPDEMATMGFAKAPATDGDESPVQADETLPKKPPLDDLDDPIPVVAITGVIGRKAGRSDKLAEKMGRKNYPVVQVARKWYCQRKDAIAMFPHHKQRIQEI